MRVLVDTHVLLWTYTNPGRLRGRAQSTLADPATEAVVSVASLWEIAIKSALGQFRAPDDLPQLLQEAGYEVLPVLTRHAWHVKTLPLHHGDPFDRLLVAQAQVEDIPFITHDRALERYDVRIIRA